MTLAPLTAFGPEHFDRLIAWFSDEAAVMQWGGADMRWPLDHAQLWAMLDEARANPPARWLLVSESAPWPPVSESDAALLAHAQVALDWRHGVARLARVGINPALRGRGLAVPFLREVLRRVFADPAFERAELNVYTFNHAAIRTYEQLGFQHEGTRRSAVKAGGQRWDTAMFGLLRGEARL